MDDASEWVRWWRAEGLRQMRVVLWTHWDPLGLRALAPDDEYDSYANILASKLKRGNDRSDIVDYLTTSHVETDDVITPKWRAKCEKAADALFDWYAQSNAPR